ncbi:PAQR family membrane homeostasis protein TrhA [Raineyella fluvialis]|uniref:Hemolysin III family protein n=1 Tax=Raineyella fluvialis TaxID=2662261 RepID=A0A5Q2FE77_9ACTN|nr:hemolysin III family protein [Raineyella fluvialis]QGF24107.1 hemolysin III family protein [Raineyella fluvialis]
MPGPRLTRPDDFAGPVKPRFRGWIHAVMAPVMLLIGFGLLIWTPTAGLRAAVVVYTVSALELFGCSALYHRFYWGPGATTLLRRLDHSNIFVFIAGTYTPLGVAMLHGADRLTLLSVVWGTAVCGVLFRVFWLTAPRWLYTFLYVAMGWTAMWWLPAFWRVGGPGVVILMLAGGLVYTAGAVVYARKRPDPSPAWFGYHEIFHTATAVAAICHAVAIGLAIAGI